MTHCCKTRPFASAGSPSAQFRNATGDRSFQAYDPEMVLDDHSNHSKWIELIILIATYHWCHHFHYHCHCHQLSLIWLIPNNHSCYHYHYHSKLSFDIRSVIITVIIVLWYTTLYYHRWNLSFAVEIFCSIAIYYLFV